MRLIKKRFEKSMDKYDQNAVVQRLMAEKLVRELVKIRSSFDTVLELGAGTGILTRELVPQISFKKYISNDLCEKSKQYVKEILLHYVPQNDVYFVTGDARKIRAKSGLIVSNAVMQWINDWSFLHRLAEPGGIVAFTTFLPENFREIKELTGLGLEYKTPDEIKLTLKNYEILYTEEFEHKLKFKSPLELLVHMKHTGVNSLGSWTFSQVKDFCERCKTPELTYAPVIVIAKA